MKAKLLKPDHSMTYSKSFQTTVTELSSRQMSTPINGQMLDYTRSTLRNYWQNYRSEIDGLVVKWHRSGNVTAAEEARTELTRCECFEGFLLLQTAPNPDSVELAKLRHRTIQAVKLLTSALQKETSRGGLN